MGEEVIVIVTLTIMKPSLCSTFRSLAFQTYAQLAIARHVGHQPLEETFTDLNILKLKIQHPFEVASVTFNKRQEGKNGADWEWWLTNSARDKFLALRVQAKILNLKKDLFEHLHYRNSVGTYQLKILENESIKEQLIPLYCFYSQGIVMPENISSCVTFSYDPKSYGCSIATLDYIEKLQKDGQKNDAKIVLTNAKPWHCLVCCKGYGGQDLPTRTWNYIKSVFDEESLSKFYEDKESPFKSRDEVPDYVELALRKIDVTSSDANADWDGSIEVYSENGAYGALIIASTEDN